jgi:hypothetical protein
MSDYLEQSAIRERLLSESRICAQAGSPMYAHILQLAANEVQRGSPLRRVMDAGCTSGLGPRGARFLAGLHEIVLAGDASDLSRFYPSVGGDWRGQGLRDALLETCTRFSNRLAVSINRPIQANEVGRSAALLVGFHIFRSMTGLPLRILEVGASAGLNLFWDYFFYSGPGWSWGPDGSAVRLTEHFERGNPVHLDRPFEITERLGCDKAPMSCHSTSDLIRMKSFIWADQAGYRFSLLESAWSLVAAQNFAVDEDDALEWLKSKSLLVAGTATIVFHSIFWEYLSDSNQEAIRKTIFNAGESATEVKPLAWLRLEPSGPARIPSVRITTWPQKYDELLASCRFDGSGIRCTGVRPVGSHPALPAENTKATDTA